MGVRGYASPQCPGPAPVMAALRGETEVVVVVAVVVVVGCAPAEVTFPGTALPPWPPRPWG